MKTRILFYHRLCVFIYVLLVSVIFCGCDVSHMAKERSNLLQTSTEVNGYLISIVEFDSCQYLISGQGVSQMMTHKGNCKFCAERDKLIHSK